MLKNKSSTPSAAAGGPALAPSKRFAEGKTLPQGGFIPPEDLNKMGPQTNEVCLGVDDLKPFDAMEFAEALI